MPKVFRTSRLVDEIEPWTIPHVYRPTNYWIK
jgi:hypothetical protein